MLTDRRRDVRECFSRIRISKAVLITILYLFISSIFIVIGINELSDLGAELLASYILYSVPFLLYLYTIRKYDLSYIAIFEGSMSDLRQVWFFIPLFVMTIGVVWVTILLFNLVSADLAESYFNWLNSIELYETGPDTTLIQYSLIFIGVAIFVPLVEEIIFRGIMIERLGTKYGYKVAVLLSSFIFGVLHLDVMGAFIFGVVLSVIYLRTRSLLLPFLIHAANNGAVVLLIFLGDPFSFDAWDTVEPFLENFWTGILLFVVSVVWLIWFLNREWKIVHDAEPFPLKIKEEVIKVDG